MTSVEPRRAAKPQNKTTWPRTARPGPDLPPPPLSHHQTPTLCFCCIYRNQLEDKCWDSCTAGLEREKKASPKFVHMPHTQISTRLADVERGGGEGRGGSGGGRRYEAGLKPKPFSQSGWFRSRLSRRQKRRWWWWWGWHWSSISLLNLNLCTQTLLKQRLYLKLERNIVSVTLYPTPIDMAFCCGGRWSFPLVETDLHRLLLEANRLLNAGLIF